jgi:hypothetical protein
LRHGNGRPDDAAVTHRAHRPPATVPARRGMRTAWFRGRTPNEAEVPVEPAVEPPPDAGAPSPDPGSAPMLPPAVRPAFGHPTF